MGQGDGEAPAGPPYCEQTAARPRTVTDTRLRIALCVCVGRRSAVKATGSVSLHPRRCGHMGGPLPRAPHPLVVQIVR